MIKSCHTAALFPLLLSIPCLSGQSCAVRKQHCFQPQLGLFQHFALVGSLAQAVIIIHSVNKRCDQPPHLCSSISPLAYLDLNLSCVGPSKDREGDKFGSWWVEVKLLQIKHLTHSVTFSHYKKFFILAETDSFMWSFFLRALQGFTKFS